MKTYVYVWWYIAEFFLEWEMFQTEFVEKIKTRILCLITSLQKLCPYEIMWKNVVQLQAIDDE